MTLPLAIDHLPGCHIFAILADFRRLAFSSGENMLPAGEATQSPHIRFAAGCGGRAAIVCVMVCVHWRLRFHSAQIQHDGRQRYRRRDKTKFEIQIRGPLVYSISQYYSKLHARA
jgi:hypothetical protein